MAHILDSFNSSTRRRQLEQQQMGDEGGGPMGGMADMDAVRQVESRLAGGDNPYALQAPPRQVENMRGEVGLSMAGDRGRRPPERRGGLGRFWDSYNRERRGVQGQGRVGQGGGLVGRGLDIAMEMGRRQPEVRGGEAEGDSMALSQGGGMRQVLIRKLMGGGW